MSGTGNYTKGDEPGSTTRPDGTQITTTGVDPNNPNNRTPITAPPTNYNFGQYSTPQYTLTPQSGYTGLAQQLMQSFNLSPQPYAPPRTGLLPMYASPWGVIPGMNPNQQSLAQMWGQNPAQGTAPPPGTPGYLNINTPPGGNNAPPPPPPQQPPPPGSSTPSAPYTPPPPTPGAPPPNVPSGRGIPAAAKMDPNAPVFRNQAKQAAFNANPMNKGGMSNPPMPTGDYSTPDPGANYGYGGTPGGLLGNFAAMGGDVGRFGGAMAMMAQKRNEMYRGPEGLNDAQLFQAGKQGIDPRDMQNVMWNTKGDGSVQSNWLDRNSLQPYQNQHEYFRATKNPGVYGKK